jgi:hypothetical protein
VAVALAAVGCTDGHEPESAAPPGPSAAASPVTAELVAGQGTTLRRDGFELTVPGEAVAASGPVEVAAVPRGRAKQALAQAGIPARLAGAPVAIDADAQLRGPARLSWQLDDVDAETPVAVVRRRDDDTLRLVGVQRDGDTATVAAEDFSSWWPIQFDRDAVENLVEGVVAPFEAQRVTPVAEPTCDGEPTGYDFTHPDHDRMRWCAGLSGTDQLRITVANNRFGTAELSWAAGRGADIELRSRSDAEISIARGGRALLEAIENKAGPETAYIPRGATVTLAVNAEPGEVATIRSAVAGEAVLIDALVLGIDVYLAVVGAVAGDAARDRAIQLMDSSQTVNCVSGVASRFSTAGDRGDVVAEGVDLIVGCLSEQLDEALGASGEVAVGPVAGVVSMAVTATSGLLTSGQGVYDEFTGKDIYDLGITATTQPLKPDTPIDIRGVGAVEAGMTVEEAELATGQEFTFFQFDNGYCYYVGVPGIDAYSFIAQPPGEPEEFVPNPNYEPVSDPHHGEIVSVTAYEPVARTLSGVSPGDPRRAVEAAYDRLTVERHVYEPDGANLYVYGQDADDGFGVRFEVNDDGIVDAIHAGERDDIALLEGCV